MLLATSHVLATDFPPTWHLPLPLLQEASIMATLRHPCIVSYIGACLVRQKVEQR